MLKIEIDTFLKMVSFKCPNCGILLTYDFSIELPPTKCIYCKVRMIPSVEELMESAFVRAAYHKNKY